VNALTGESTKISLVIDAMDGYASARDVLKIEKQVMITTRVCSCDFFF
jgi:hypothetical protein